MIAPVMWRVNEREGEPGTLMILAQFPPITVANLIRPRITFGIPTRKLYPIIIVKRNPGRTMAPISIANPTLTWFQLFEVITPDLT